MHMEAFHAAADGLAFLLLNAHYVSMVWLTLPMR